MPTDTHAATSERLKTHTLVHKQTDMSESRLRKRQTENQRQGISKTHTQTPGNKQTRAVAMQKRETHEYTTTQMKRYCTNAGVVVRERDTVETEV